jgi:hypothetical protein
MTLKQLKKRLNPVAQKAGLYTAYELSLNELVGTYDDVPTGVRNWLFKDGYETAPSIVGVTLTAAKTHPLTDEVHSYSIRRVDPDNPRWQWHVHLWYVQGATEIFSHYEMRPDFKKIDGEDTAEMIGRLKIHYRPEYGREYYRGEADPVVTDLVND